MAISNYGELKTAVANWLNHDNLTERVPEFIALAEDRIYGELRIREMEASTTITTTASQQTDTLPSGWLQGRRLYYDASPDKVIRYQTPTNFWAMRGSQTTGEPEIYTTEGENLVWGPIPESALSIKVLYYAEPSAFSTDSDSNAVFLKYRGLFLFGALLEAEGYLQNDPRILTWAAKFQDLMDVAKRADRDDRMSQELMQRDLVPVI